MEPKRLGTFVAVVRAGSISDAADDLGISQPAVSQQMKLLEAECGSPLFLRNKSKLALTPAGKALLEHAEVITQELDAAEKHLDAVRGNASGLVRVAAFPSVAATILPDALRIAKQKQYALDVRLTEAEPEVGTELLARGEVDLMLGFRHSTLSIAEPESFSVELLTEPLYVVLPTGHPLAARKRVKMADFAGERWIEGCYFCRENLMVAARAAGFEADVEQSTDDYVVTQRLVASGLGIALLPELALKSVKLPGVVALPVPDGGTRTIYVRAWPGADRVPVYASLIECLQQASGS